MLHLVKSTNIKIKCNYIISIMWRYYIFYLTYRTLHVSEYHRHYKVGHLW